MILFAVPLIVFMIGLALWKTEDWNNDVAAAPVTVISGMILAAVFIVFSVIRGDSDNTPAKHAKTLGYLNIVDERANVAVSLSTRIMLRKEIEEINVEIKQAKEWNPGLLDIWFSDETAKLEPIE